MDVVSFALSGKLEQTQQRLHKVRKDIASQPPPEAKYTNDARLDHICSPILHIHIPVISAYGDKIPDELEGGLLGSGLLSGGPFPRKILPYFMSYVVHISDILFCDTLQHCHIDEEKAYMAGWDLYSRFVSSPVGEEIQIVALIIDIASTTTLKSIEISLNPPLLGILGDHAAVAVLNSSDIHSQRIVEAEIKTWIYGDWFLDTESPSNPIFSEISLAEICFRNALDTLESIVDIIQHSRQVRLGQAAKSILLECIERMEHVSKILLGGNAIINNKDYISAVLGDSKELWQRVDVLMHHPDFGAEPRMPMMHTVALLLPFGLPLLITFIRTIKEMIRRGKKTKQE